MIRPIAALLVLGLAGSAAAQTPPPPPAKGAMRVCRSELPQVCPGVERGKPMRACVKANLAKFSPACQQAIAAKRAARKAAKQAAAVAKPSAN